VVRDFLATIAGGPAVLVLEGNAGAGKTTLFRAGLEIAREQGARVLHAGPTRAESELSFAGLGDLVGDWLDEVELPEPQLRALQAALLLEPPPEEEIRTPAIGFALLGSLRALARADRVLVAIDDLQWLDARTAEAITFAVRRLRDAPVRVLATRRTGDGGATFEDESTIPVGPLSLGATRRILADQLGLSFPRATLTRLHEVSGGNALYALELARVVAALGGRIEPGGDIPVPADLSALLRERLVELPERTRDALTAAALAAQPTVALVAAVIGADAWDTLMPALDADVVELEGERIRFAHPLLAAAALSRVDPERRRELHGRLAKIVDDAEERARHLARASVGQDVQAARALEAAAATARRRGARDASADLLEQAARLTPERSECARLTIAAAAEHTAAEDATRASRLLTALLETLDPGTQRAEALLGLLRADADVDRYHVLAQEALREARAEPRLRAAILLELAEWKEISSGIAAALQHAREAVVLAERVGEPSLLAQALAFVGHLETLAGGDWLAPLNRALELEHQGAEIGPWLSPRHWIGVRLMWGDELDRARELLEEGRRKAVDAGDWASQSGLCFHLAQLETRAGDATRARGYAEEGWELAEPSGLTQATAVNAYARALVEAHFGDAEVARRIAIETLGVFESLGDRFFTIHTRSVLAGLALSCGDHASAAEALASARDLRAATGVGEPGIFPFDADEIEALIGVGRVDEATVLTDEFAEWGERLRRPRMLATSLRCRGLLAAADGDPAAGIASLEAALVEHEQLPVPLERGRTLLTLGQVRRRLRQKRAARSALEDALAIFEQIGTPRWAQKARAELARIGGRPPSTGELTVTERRIAELVAEGRANKEVARELFVTVKTVERNLSRVYEKLGIRSRAELARRYAREEPGAR
jgi:DNA-binding CsgD family transcriptional regulator